MVCVCLDWFALYSLEHTLQGEKSLNVKRYLNKQHIEMSKLVCCCVLLSLLSVAGLLLLLVCCWFVVVFVVGLLLLLSVVVGLLLVCCCWSVVVGLLLFVVVLLYFIIRTQPAYPSGVVKEADHQPVIHSLPHSSSLHQIIPQAFLPMVISPQRRPDLTRT